MSEPRREESFSLQARRLGQKREAARGCLLAMVMEGAAILAGVLWVVSLLAGWRRMATAAAVALAAFTIATMGVVLFLVVTGNTAHQRRLRQEAEAAETQSLAEDERAK